MHKAIRLVAVLLVVAALVLAATALMLGRRQAPVDAPPLVEAALPGVSGGHRHVVAVEELPAGVPIARDAVAETTVAQPVAGGFASLEQAVGEVPLRTIAAGAVLERDAFAHGVASLLAPGERAIAIPVDELAGAGNRISPGDHVDVFLSLRGAGAGDAASAQSRLLLSRLRVLGYGAMDLPGSHSADAAPVQAPGGDRRAQAIAGNGAEPAANDRSAQANARSALLAVPVEQANALLLGAQSGKLFLALRHPGDAGIADASLFPQPRPVLAPRSGLDDTQRTLAEAAPDNTAFSGIDLDALAGQARRAEPAPTPPAAPRSGSPARERGIEIIRGDGRSTGATAF